MTALHRHLHICFPRCTLRARAWTFNCKENKEGKFQAEREVNDLQFNLLTSQMRKDEGRETPTQKVHKAFNKASTADFFLKKSGSHKGISTAPLFPLAGTWVQRQFHQVTLNPSGILRHKAFRPSGGLWTPDEAEGRSEQTWRTL